MESKKIRLLIAEDDPGARKLYEKAFKQEGYEVVLVEAGGQILAEISESSFDLLITDLKLAAMSALEVLPVVRQKRPNMPVIVVSGHYVNLVEDFHRKGFNVNMFLHKPLSLAELKKAVRSLLGLPEEAPKAAVS
jgi:DNA-binding NtrC family response regulator